MFEINLVSQVRDLLTSSKKRKRGISQRSSWGFETERLEERAYLSAVVEMGDDSPVVGELTTDDCLAVTANTDTDAGTTAYAASESSFESSKGVSKKKAARPNVAGSWQVSANVAGFGNLSGVLNVTQKKGKISASTSLQGVSLKLVGKLNKKSPTNLRGKATVSNIPSVGTVTAPFEINYDAEFASFNGTASTDFGNIAFTGTRVI